MSYQIVQAADAKEMFKGIYDFLTAPETLWTWVDGTVAGSPVAKATFDATPAASFDYVSDDYFVLQLPGKGPAETDGVIQVVCLDANNISLHAWPEGWDAVGHTPLGSIELGSSNNVLLNAAAITLPLELRLIANSRRLIVVSIDSDTPTPVVEMGYLGYIQPFDSTDTNPLAVGSGAAFGSTGGSARTYYMQLVSSGAEGAFKEGHPGGFTFADTTSMLETAQPNTRGEVPEVTRVLFPCIVGTIVTDNIELRGELDGVFFFGPDGSLSNDTTIARSDGTYLVHSSVALGPVT